MRRMAARATVLLLLGLLSGGGLAWANGVGFSGSVGLETTVVPVPPLSYNISSELALSLSVADFSFNSNTVFDLSGFQSQYFAVSVGLGAVRIADGILFDPYFARNTLSVDLEIVGIRVGIDLILADVGVPPIPAYSVGTVLELSSSVVSGFTITTLTGFGAADLVNLLDGVEAPFSHDLSYLFSYLDLLFGPAPTWEVTVVPGFYFEEELVRLEVGCAGLVASSTTWLSWTGFAREIFEFGYQFQEPTISFLTALELDDTFAISGLDFLLDLVIEGVRFTSWTSFSQPALPSLIPIVFSGQGFAVSFELCGARITAETDFDSTFLFEQQLLGIEATFEPVTFKSLTAFDAGGFAGEWISASVTFSGVSLYTRAAFDAGGIIEIVFGFEFTF